jgi:hypothetical protein
MMDTVHASGSVIVPRRVPLLWYGKTVAAVVAQVREGASGALYQCVMRCAL